MPSSFEEIMEMSETLELLDIPYEEIELATNNFADENLVAQGTTFKVYKGQLLQSGELINIVARKTRSFTEIFYNPVLNHENISSIFKICQYKDELIIINKHEMNGSLEKYLSGPTLTWMQRLRVCVGVARALKHLQHDALDNDYIIHGRIKSSKILLDHNWDPKLHGFGVALLERKYFLCVTGIPSYSRCSQYLDPGYEKTKGLTHKSDIFSFGVLMFEVLFGREAFIQNIDNWAFVKLSRSHCEEKTLDALIDPDLRKQMNLQSLDIFAETAFYCVKELRTERPSMLRVLSQLEEALKLQHKHEHPITTFAALPSNYLKGKSLNHLKLRLRDIKLATDMFSNSCCIGSGAYGEVYKAQLNLNKVVVEGKKYGTVAIKRFFSRNDGLGEEAFSAEIEMLCKCKHPNIVSLQGVCEEENEMILVYEYVSNGSLADYLGDNKKMKKFTWAKRIQLCLDMAHGLHYLHTSTHDKQSIIHRDIKSANVLLDDKWVAKIGDFGLSKLFCATQEASTLLTRTIAGTETYTDPEYKKTGKLKTQSDVYSFGVVLFEIMCGKLTFDKSFGEKGLPLVARQCFNEKTLDSLVDPELREADENIFMLVGGVDQDSLNTFTQVAYNCLEETQSERPSMEVVIHELEKALNFQKKRMDNLVISLKDIQYGTKDFSDINCIGESHNWKLYEGEVGLANKITSIYAKRWSNTRSTDNLFINELQILAKYKHKNIIGFLGFCSEMKEHIIVYEHAFNRRLDKHLDDHNLTWLKRLKICIDVANVLEFLHKGGGEHGNTVVHRYIDSSSILLDHDWNAKLSNFEYSSKLAVSDRDCCIDQSSDISALGVILIDMLCGRWANQDGNKNYHLVGYFILKHYNEKGNLDEMIFEGIKKQIAPKSLLAFQSIIIQCFTDALSTSDVVMQLKKALKFQEDYEIWVPKLPINYKEIIQKSKFLVDTESEMDVYNMFLKGILLEKTVSLSLGNNGEMNEMISAMKFSYKQRKRRKLRSILESRFQKVAEVFDTSTLKIQIRVKTQYLSADVNYGAYLVFKICDIRKTSSKPMYVNLKYRKGREKLHAYFATWREDNWMEIELCSFLNHKKDTYFDVSLTSLSRHHCGNSSIYIEGIEFRSIENKVKHEEIKQVKQVLELNSNTDRDSFEMLKRSETLLLNEVNTKKHLVLSGMEVVVSSSVKHFHLQPPAGSGFKEVIELLPVEVFHIKCKIQSQMLSHDTKYLCYLVFKLSEKCVGLHCPVIVRDFVCQNKNEAEVLYFRSPRSWNLHENHSVPRQRDDGWMEVKIWKFNSNHQRNNFCIPLNLKLITYEGSMSGLIVCGLEFRPV